ncbi:MAG: tetratricopeptide repeat protein [Chitinophagaceae bacterium]
MIFYKKIIPTLLLGCCIVAGNAQETIDNNLKRSLESEKMDTAEVSLLEELSYTYLTSKPDTALLLAEKALLISKEIKYKKGEAVSLNRIGTVLNSTGNYPHALENFLQSLQINEDIDNKNGIMRNLGNIGNVYANQGDFREALNYSFREKLIAEDVPDEELLIISLLSIGDTYEKLNKLDSARVYTKQAHELSLKIKSDGLTGIALNNLGNIYSKMNEVAAAMQFYRSSLFYYEKDNDDEGICETTLGMARLFQQSGITDSALYYAKQSVTIAKQSGFTKYLLDASRFLTDYYKSKKNIDSAFLYKEISTAANDSLFDEEKIKQVHALYFSEKLREQEKEKEKKKAEEERRNNLQLVGIATVIISFFLFLLLLRRRKTPARTVEVLGLIGLLLLFEFVALLLHPLIASVTNHKPVFMMMVLVAIAALLVPIHRYLEKMIKEKLSYKIDSNPKRPKRNPEKYRS